MIKSLLSHCILSFILLATLVHCNKERHFAISTHDLAKLVDVEDNLLEHMQEYINAIQTQINILRPMIKSAEERFRNAEKDPEVFVTNILNGLPMVRRMHEDAPKLVKLLKEPSWHRIGNNIADLKLDFITKLDVEEAIKELLTIQKTYDLKVKDIAYGRLRGKQYDAKMSALDCYAVGMHLEHIKKYKIATEWFKMAWQLYEEDEPSGVLGITRNVILKKLLDIFKKLDDVDSISSVIESAMKIKKLTPEDQHIINYNKMAVKNYLAHLRNCRGEGKVPPSAALHCKYSTEMTPFLRLAPLKWEQLSLDPYVGIYYNAIHSKEINDLKEISTPLMIRATVGDDVLDDMRTAMTTSVRWNQTNNLLRLHRRIEDMSGLELKGGEDLAVINYGLGGQYFNHYDCFFSDDQITELSYPYGNRVATILFYLSEVRAGGYTSFPVLGFAVKPQLGNALLFYNMNSKNECDDRTLHAACPLLRGDRWVTTKFINTKPQWRTRPCLADHK